jgi:thiamine biosynthesis lipoprotein
MGTTYQVTYAGNASRTGVAQDAEELLAEITFSLSTYDTTSIISAINASTDTTAWHPIDKHFLAVFRRSREIYEDTGHTFNPAVGPLVNAWGFGPEDHDTSPDEKTVRKLLEVVRFDAFELQESPPAVRKRMATAKLDFSAIGEGYAIDAIGEMLEGHGVRDYLIELGGELRARGRAWKVGIERPGLAELRVVQLKDAGLATSGTTRNFRMENGKKIAHILDPRTGHPAESSLVSVSVMAKDTTTADALATALMVMGLEEGMRFVDARPELQAYFIAMDGGKMVEEETAGFPREKKDGEF